MSNTLRFPSKPKNNANNNSVPTTFARNSPIARSPNNANKSNKISKIAKIDSNVSYLQQVFIQRKEEE